MSKATEVKAFYDELINKVNLTPEEKKFLDSLLDKDEVSNVFKAGLSATSRFHQEMDKLKKQQKQQEETYSKKLTELDTLRQTLSVTSSADTKKLQELQEKIEAKEHDLQARNAKLQSIEQTLQGYTVDGKPIVDMLDLKSIPSYTPPSRKEEPPQPKAMPSITKEDILKELNPTLESNAKALAKLPFDLLDFQQEYSRLTGKHLSAGEFYQKVTEDGTGDYHSVFMREYDIDNLRKAKEREALEATIRKELDEKYQREYNARLTPSSLQQPKESDFYKSIDSNRPKEEVTTNPQGLSDRAEVVSEAARVFNELRAAKEARA